jgi:NDP-sugar pyrophosphorylase family protein
MYLSDSFFVPLRNFILKKRILMAWRKLTDSEIKVLTEQFCRCDDWNKINVAECFTPKHIRNSNFSGEVYIGIFEKEITFFGGVKKHSGIFNATIHHCKVGNNVYIGQIRNYIANYNIEDDVVIENVDLLAVDGVSSFGNGTLVGVLNETGGRELPIYDHLSAQLAYILALYRHRPVVINKITAMINDYIKSVSSETGTIGKNACLTNCRTLCNLRIGSYARLDGIYRVQNGTINSNEAAPTYFGPGVIAENFIASTGSSVTQGAEIFDTFIGQGCVLGKQYSAENSLFFANCQGLHGEACAIFAGPYTVTHHKSTLLIAGYFSFLNAGSGSNQSNHMYKLGPIHQGIVERGSKTTSDSYLLWPAKIGPFTLVMGRHYKHSDTSDLPFSYLIESGDDSILVPGANLRSVGTIRDAKKWPMRDKRTDPHKLDHINYNLLSPFTIHRMIKALDILQMLKKISGETSDFYSYQSAKIKPSSLKNGLKLYDLAILKFLGNSIIKRLENTRFENDEAIRERLRPDTTTGIGDWLDLAGLIAPQSEVKQLMTHIETDVICSLEAIEKTFEKMHQNYYAYEWTWAIDQIQKRFGKTIEEFTAADVIGIVKLWKESVIELDHLTSKDAKKEFSLNSKIGFGIDGDEDARDLDFECVRGEFEQNPFVKEILEHIRCKTELGDELIARLSL